MNRKLIILPLAAALLYGCAKEPAAISENGEILPGEAVMFTTYLPDVTETKSAREEWESRVNNYKVVDSEYTFSIEMWKEGDAAASGSANYKPQAESTDGTLQHSGVETELYWPDNVNNWGFKATSVSSAAIEVDQSDSQKWLYQDLLVGHSYLPLWTGDDATGSGTDPDVIQYKTSKQWYADNKLAKDLSRLMVTSNEDYKKIPLYMKHQRAWITIILKAGEGVKREALAYSSSAANIAMTINSYALSGGGMVKTAVTSPLSTEAFIHYDSDKNGDAADNVSTTRYDAIVMPHDYTTKKEEEAIANVSLSNQNFSFYAANDGRYLGTTPWSDDEAKTVYNLEAGKHLTIEVTLSRESRKILITAWIQDWTEVATQTICDDYGQNGDPIVIKNKTELINFLSSSSTNKQGSVGILQPTELDLDAESDWVSTYDLNATLNMAGCKFTTKHRLFNKMSESANLVNGTVVIPEGSEVDCAIADSCAGTIERVDVTVASEITTAMATVAGLVNVNTGTIYKCTSELPVHGTTGQSVSGESSGYIGGIAAVSTSPSASSRAVIDGCTVNAAVDGGSDVKGGGIVGYVTGRVSNNTFEYGITVSQDAVNFKNIFAKSGSTETSAFGNSWPTTALNYINESSQDTNPNAYTGTKYDAVIDSQAQLNTVMNDASYNTAGKVIRVSKSFSVASSATAEEDWTHGMVSSDDIQAGVNNVSFTLDGNDKTITLTGTKTVQTTDGDTSATGTVTTYTTAPMLFNCILGEVKNLILYLDKPVVASPSVKSATEPTYTAVDAVAPLAYAVYGANGKVTNVKVKGADGSFVQAATPAGLVVWAYGGATISECKVNIPVKMWLPKSVGSDSRQYGGGLVACAIKANFEQCQYLGNSESSISGASSSAMSSTNCFLGGIVGGTSVKKSSSETPKLSINDCYSWYVALPVDSRTDTTDKTSKGGIIAYSCYTNSDTSAIVNGMADDNQGNWWPQSAMGVHTYASTLTEEKVIGKRNSVTPTYDTNF